ALRHKLREPLWRDQAIAAADESLDFPPVSRAVQPDANPSLGAEIGGNEKSRRLGFEHELSRAGRNLAPEREPAAPRPLEREDPVGDPVRRPAPHEFFLHSGSE